jgi:hypothetical protein
MTTKREIDSQVEHLLAAHNAAMERYRRAWGTADLVPAARDAEETLKRLKEFAELWAPGYNSLPLS